MKSFNDYIKEAALSAKQKKIAKIAGDKDKIDADDLAALRAGKKPVEEAKKCMDEDDMDESGLRMAAHSAHKAGKKEFEFQGKTYPVKVQKEETEQIDEAKYGIDVHRNKLSKLLTHASNAGIKAKVVSHNPNWEKQNAGGEHVVHLHGKDEHVRKFIQKHHDNDPQATDDYKEYGKSVKEEVEQIDELSKKTLGSYVKKASGDLASSIHYERDAEENDDKDAADVYSRRAGNRISGLQNAGKKIAKEEVEQIDELSKKTLGSYVKKASHDARMMGQISSDFENRSDKARKQSKRDSNYRLSRKYLEKAWKRDTGIGKAVDKLTKEDASDYRNNPKADQAWKEHEAWANSAVATAAKEATKRAQQATAAARKEDDNDDSDQQYDAHKEAARLHKSAMKHYKKGSDDYKHHEKMADQHKQILGEEVVQIDEGKMKDIYTSMMHHADKKGYTSHKQFTPADYDTVGKEHGISGGDLAIIAGHKTAAQVGHERAHQLALKGMQSLSKEEVERIEEKLAQMDETVWDGGAAEREIEKMRNRKPDVVSLGGREQPQRRPDLVGRPTKPDRERDELKNFRGYKQNTGKHVANVDKAIADKHSKSAADKHPVPAHAPITAADKKAPHKVHSNPFAKGYHGQDKRVHEEVERIEELSKKTLGSYAHKATDDAQDKAHDAYDSGTPTRHELEVQGGKNNKGEYEHKPLQNRLTGVARAAKKLGDKSISKHAEKSVAHHLKQRYHWDNMNDGKAARSDDAARGQSGKAHEKIHKASGVDESVEQEMSPYLKATLAVMDEGKIDDLRDAQKIRQSEKSAYDKDFKADTSHPSVTVHKGTAYGGSAQKDDETDEKPETKEKRSAGRPSGTSTGARLKGSKKEKDDIDGREYSLHLPK